LRYRQLVVEHWHVSDPLAAGSHALAVPGLADGFAAVIGAHRFWYNDSASLPQRIQPLHQLAHQWRQQHPPDWGLVIHDWSVLSYPSHRRQTDQIKINSGRGYELTTLLLVDGSTGHPVAPLELRLRSAKGVFSTRRPAPAQKAFRIDEVLPSMEAVGGLGLGQRLVHVIDREADALAQYRVWQAAGHFFLVRARGNRKVRWQGEELSLGQLAKRLPRRRCREVQYQGHKAVQQVAETEVVLDRPAWRHRVRVGRVIHERVYGVAVPLRLIVSWVCDSNGQTLAVWYLLTNLPAEVNGDTVALWYYWRWQIETLFKLLKSAGQQVEHWKQPNGEAIAKRLVVAATACALVWRLERHPSAEAVTVRQLLVRLSGRQMKWGRTSTASALLAGLWVLLAMLAVLQEHSVEELRQFKKLVLDIADEDSG
jgi:hypothetical protein